MYAAASPDNRDGGWIGLLTAGFDAEMLRIVERHRGQSEIGNSSSQHDRENNADKSAALHSIFGYLNLEPFSMSRTVSGCRTASWVRK
jgi:hypothetical protein